MAGLAHTKLEKFFFPPLVFKGKVVGVHTNFGWWVVVEKKRVL